MSQLPTTPFAQNALPEAARTVENLFAGDFGKAYTERNDTVDPRKPAFFHDLFKRNGVARVLEGGCNLGLNLRDAAKDPAIEVWGLDIQRDALRQAAEAMPEAVFTPGSLFELPFRDAWFDLVFTCGVLIHVPPEGLPKAMAELYRVSKRYVMCAEYHDEHEVEVPYRGHTRALWRRNYAKVWQDTFADLDIVEQGFKGPDEGFDRITWTLLRKRNA